HEGYPHKVSQRRKRAMITKLNVASIMAPNKSESLDFYVNQLGLEKGQDVKQGSYRWLTVRVPGAVTEISLEEPGPPVHDEATAAQLRELITKGALGGLVFKADDIRGLYETLKSRGVTDFTQEPTDHFYGTDMGVRDPFGNAIRILQQGKVPNAAKPNQCREESRKKRAAKVRQNLRPQPGGGRRNHRRGKGRREGPGPRAKSVPSKSRGGK